MLKKTKKHITILSLEHEESGSKAYPTSEKRESLCQLDTDREGITQAVTSELTLDKK